VAPLAQVIDVGDIVSVIWTALVAGIGVCAIFSLAIIGFARTTDMRREGNVVAAGAYAVLTLLAFGAVLAVAAFGVVVMTAK
jgi:hypothetical protein